MHLDADPGQVCEDAVQDGASLTTPVIVVIGPSRLITNSIEDGASVRSETLPRNSIRWVAGTCVISALEH